MFKWNRKERNLGGIAIDKVGKGPNRDSPEIGTKCSIENRAILSDIGGSTSRRAGKRAMVCAIIGSTVQRLGLK